MSISVPVILKPPRGWAASYVKPCVIALILVACFADIILPRLVTSGEAAPISLFYTLNEVNDLPEMRLEFPFNKSKMAF